MNDAAANRDFSAEWNKVTQNAMTLTQRKFIGGISLVVFSVIYYSFVITVALARLPNLATGWHILFYFLSVVIWFIPSALIIRWIGPGKQN